MKDRKADFENALTTAIDGDVRFDSISRTAYSVDASIYEIEPVGIVIPRHKEDLCKAVQIAREYGVPIIPRGAATGITGGAIGKGLIIDLSKYLDTITSIDFDAEYAVCQPGVVQDRLNEALSQKGYRLGPDTSTGNRATIGGMIGNNAAGSRSLKYGKMVDHVEGMELLLSNGDLINLSALDESAVMTKEMLPSREGDIYKATSHIKTNLRSEIEKRFPNIPRRTSGYNFDELIKPEALNLSKLIVGSEGTLGIVTEVKLKICRKPMITALCLIHFNDVIQAMEAIPMLLPFSPISLEMLDDKILAAAHMQGKSGKSTPFIKGMPAALFIAEFEASNQEEIDSKIGDFAFFIEQRKIGYALTSVRNPHDMAQIWSIRKGGLGLLLSKRSYSRAIAFIEDISLPPDRLGPFMTKFLDYLRSIGKEAGIYGHVGAGCMHIRPYIDLRSEKELHLMENTMIAVADMLLEFGGSLSGEHGDGYIRSWLNKKMFGDDVYQGFCDIKNAFDPENLFNPGKIVHAPPLLHDLRWKPEAPLTKIPTFLNFDDQGGIELAADLCNGNGLCRKSESLMCPSFQATHDELDTTRARAQALRAVINGKWNIDKFKGPEIGSVMDLCLECKGCKTECPSSVDMAKMKAEYLFQHQEKYGYSLRSRLFGHIGTFYRVAAPFAWLSNWVASTRGAKKLLSWLGIAPERSLPEMARKRFSDWFGRQQQKSASNPDAKAVILFNDTYTEFNQPEIGKAAFKVLDSLGYRIIVPKWACCGKPLISKGILKSARSHAINVIEKLAPFAKLQIPIIGLEPSCLFAIKDDYQSLVPASMQVLASDISRLCVTFDSFIENHIQNGDLDLISTPQNIIVHGHCHQKAAKDMQGALSALNAMPGCTASLIDAGCCGMAGSFGYETEHYAISMKIANLKLLPAIADAKPETLVVANGISCRSQITHASTCRPLHIAEAIAMRLKS